MSAAALYYLFREERPEDKQAEENEKLDLKQITKEKTLEILQDIIKSQEQMKTIMKHLTKELIKNRYNFEKTYERVTQLQPEDPLDRYGISMADLDLLLDKYQPDPKIQAAISRIMGASNIANFPSKVPNVSKATVVKVHEYMLDELKKLVAEFNALPNRFAYEIKTVTIAAQALVGARVEEEFQLTSDDIESAVIMHHQELAADGEFARINVLMQSTMAQLIGPH